MFDPKAYDLAREMVLGDLLRAVGCLAMNLPIEAGEDLVASRGYYRDSTPLKALADAIENVTYRFDFLCYALGAEDGAVRFGHRKPPKPEGK